MITEQKTIDTILETYKSVLKKDYSVYKNHVYRIFNLALLFDNNEGNQEKYAVAAAFHDIGIWTDSFDYLAPSIKLASEYLTKIEKTEWIGEVSLMIDMHHKVTRYKGEFTNSVEAFRKADWIDVTYGITLFKLERSKYSNILKTFSNKGFHWFLTKQSLKYFVKHPFNPLPMFKK